MALCQAVACSIANDSGRLQKPVSDNERRTHFAISFSISSTRDVFQDSAMPDDTKDRIERITVHSII